MILSERLHSFRSETVQWDCVDSGSAPVYFSCTYTLSHLPRNTPLSFSLRRERSTPEERLQSQTSCVAVTSRLNGSTSTRHPHTSPSRIRCRTWKRRKGSACPLIPLACCCSVARFHSHVALRCLLFCSLKKDSFWLCTLVCPEVWLLTWITMKRHVQCNSLFFWSWSYAAPSAETGNDLWPLAVAANRTNSTNRAPRVVATRLKWLCKNPIAKSLSKFCPLKQRRFARKNTTWKMGLRGSAKSVFPPN